MPADRGRYPPPAVAIPSPPAGCLVPGLPLPQARRSREITPPARLWLNARRPASDSMPAGSPLTQARRIAADSCPPAAAIPSPVDPVHNTARSAVCMSCRAHRNILILSVMSTETRLGQAAPLAVAMEAILATCPPCRRSGSGCWGTLWGPLTPCHAQRKPQLPSQPRRASCSCGLSCPVPVCLAPEGCPVLFLCV